MPQSESLPIIPEGARYALEKLGVAVWALAVGFDTLKVRLVDASINLVIIAETDLPEDLRPLLTEIMKDLTSGKMKYELMRVDGELKMGPVGLIPSTVRFMRKEKAQRVARRICELEARLRDRLPLD